MNVVLPMVAMVFFSALCVGAFAWMRRPGFGEAEESAMRVALSSMKAQGCQVDDGPAVGRSPRTIRSPLELSNVEVEKPKEEHS
jgi:hypothetical protein